MENTYRIADKMSFRRYQFDWKRKEWHIEVHIPSYCTETIRSCLLPRKPLTYFRLVLVILEFLQICTYALLRVFLRIEPFQSC